MFFAFGSENPRTTLSSWLSSELNFQEKIPKFPLQMAGPHIVSVPCLRINHSKLHVFFESWAAQFVPKTACPQNGCVLQAQST